MGERERGRKKSGDRDVKQKEEKMGIRKME